MYSVFFRLRKRPFAVSQVETTLRSRLKFSCSWSMLEAAEKITVLLAYSITLNRPTGKGRSFM